MKIAVSVLDCVDRLESIDRLNSTNISYIHIDVMDGNFVVKSTFRDIGEIRKIGQLSRFPLDIHFMESSPIEYINQLENMNIEFITVHLEIDKDIREIVKKIHELGYKAGLAIKPGTDISKVYEYFDIIDIVLIMSVEPGMGGQKFMDITVNRVQQLKQSILEFGKNILIEVDGGINNETIKKLQGVDISVVGSYIVKSDNYNERIESLFKNI